MFLIRTMWYSTPILFHWLTNVLTVWWTLRLTTAALTNLFFVSVSQFSPLSFEFCHFLLRRFFACSYNKYRKGSKKGKKSRVFFCRSGKDVRRATIGVSCIYRSALLKNTNLQFRFQQVTVILDTLYSLLDEVHLRYYYVLKYLQVQKISLPLQYDRTNSFRVLF